MANFDENLYCNFDATATKATAGKSWVACIFDSTGAKLLAVAGQKSLKINRSANTIDTSSKDTKGGWSSAVAGVKSWSIDVDGVFVGSDEAHKELGKAFSADTPLCLKIYDTKAKKTLYGGLAILTKYDIDAPLEDFVSYQTSFQGLGELTDITTLGNADKAKATAVPEA